MDIFIYSTASWERLIVDKKDKKTKQTYEIIYKRD